MRCMEKKNKPVVIARVWIPRLFSFVGRDEVALRLGCLFPQ